MPESTTDTPSANPWADYGLNPDGSPMTPDAKPDTQAKGEGGDAKAPDPRDEKIAALEKALGEANEKLKGLDAYADKFKVVDKLVKALAGDDDPSAKVYARVWADLKAIAPPGVKKALDLLEQDPEALEKLTGSVNALHIGKLADLNVQAHNRVMDLAKKAFPTKGMTPAEIAELVFPFERAMTDIINQNQTLRERFVSGDMSVVEELFTRLTKPHVAARLREKQARSEPFAGPKAPPKGAGGPGASQDTDKDKKPDLRTPKGRAEFHRQAVNRFFARMASRDEE
jgi:hypothetical protein